MRIDPHSPPRTVLVQEARGLCWSRAGGQMRWFDGVAAWSPTNRIDLAGRRGEGWGVDNDCMMTPSEEGEGRFGFPFCFSRPRKGGDAECRGCDRV